MTRSFGRKASGNGVGTAAQASRLTRHGSRNSTTASESIKIQ
ncbi:hypothetical protein TBK1r_41280 [Stieleria magnilauensis]|uniref:Uncharacterized protein n=1 Tax=Stieleria magnilauensis TaxID=2527963 RepID=A0ABX5XTE1_9BACT|nr:hypothetical protein TBK1r_41280 [Planctomycetes bacterium TBK1r]